MKPEIKHAIRKLVREAIRRMNSQVLFTCYHCALYSCKKNDVRTCLLDCNNQLVLGKRQPTQMPDCFILEPLLSPMADVLDKMRAMGINWLVEDTGWATIVGRIAQRSSNFGYFNVTQRNLNRYES
jgi:hypothetical protein